MSNLERKVNRPTGDRLEGNYVIQRHLGEGTTGSIYVAHDPMTKRDVAVKLFIPDQAAVVQARTEARITGALRHENVLPSYGIDFDQRSEKGGRGEKVTREYPFIVMQYANKGSLRDQMDSGQPIETEEAVEIIVDVAKGVQHAHDLTILHRDIKPANILRHQKPGQEKVDTMVADFGIATRAHSGEYMFTEQTPIIGTMAYMAPEHFNGEAVKASDVYSLGIVGYELVAGQRPFTGTNAYELHRAHTSETPPSFEKVTGAKMDKDRELLEPVIAKSLAKDIKDRYKSMGDFAEAVNEAHGTAKAAKKKATTIIPVTDKPTKLVDTKRLDEDPTAAVTPTLTYTEAVRKIDAHTDKHIPTEVAASAQKEKAESPVLSRSSKDALEGAIKKHEEKDSLYHAGMIAVDLKDHDKAREMVSKLERESKFGRAGEIAVSMGDISKAQGLIKAAERLNKLEDASDIAIQLGDRDKVQEIISIFLRRGEFFEAGNCAGKIGENHRVREFMNLAVKEGKFADAAFLAINLNDMDKVIDIYTVFEKNLPTFLDLHTGDKTKALKALNVWEEFPNLQLKLNIANISLHLEDFDKVHQLLEDAEQKNHLVEAGIIAAMLNDTDKAQELSRTIEQKGEFYASAFIAEKLGDMDRANALKKKANKTELDYEIFVLLFCNMQYLELLSSEYGFKLTYRTP